MGLISRVSSRTYRRKNSNSGTNMNILHHKSWHIRNQRNIDRVRRDEEAHAAKTDDLNKRHERADRERLHNELRGDTKAVNSLLPSSQAATHGDVSTDVDREREVQERDLAFYKKIGIKQNLGHTDLHRKKPLWYMGAIRPGEDNDEEQNTRLKNKRLRDDPMSRVPREYRSLESRNNKSIIKREDLRNSDEDCKILEKKRSKKEKKSKKSRKKRKKSKKCIELSSSSDSSSEDDAVKDAKLAEMRRKRLVRENRERMKADDIRARNRGLFKHE